MIKDYMDYSDSQLCEILRIIKDLPIEETKEIKENIKKQLEKKLATV